MNSAIVLCILSMAVMALARPEEARYTDRYDNINLDEILSNHRVLEAYINCVLDLGKCSPEGKELKGHIIDGLETECSKCTKAQKEGTNRVLEHLINNETEYWAKLTAKYDPDNKYASKYEKELKKIKA